MSIEGRKDNRSFNIPNKSPDRTVIKEEHGLGGFNTKWYRLYSDGWVEQGEYLDVDVSAGAERGLLYQMADTNYIAVASTNTYTSGSGTRPLNISKTTTKVLIKAPGATGIFGSSYYVCGMTALGPSQQTRYIIKY